MSTNTQNIVFSKLPRSKSKLISLFRQYIANTYNGQRLYSYLPNFDGITSVSQLETLVLINGTEQEQKRFFDLVQEQENSMTPVNDAIFHFSKEFDIEWYQKQP